MLPIQEKGVLGQSKYFSCIGLRLPSVFALRQEMPRHRHPLRRTRIKRVIELAQLPQSKKTKRAEFFIFASEEGKSP